MTVRDFRMEDYLRIQQRKFEKMTSLGLPSPEDMARNLGNNGKSYTLEDEDGRIVACGGVVKFWQGVGEGWVITSPLVADHSIYFLLAVQRRVWRMVEEMGLERLQVVVDCANSRGIAWVKWMGFVEEGRMRKYIGGRDFYRYAWVRG